MAISDVVSKAPATAPAAPAATAQKADNDSNVFRQMGSAARAQMSEDQKAIEGTKKDKVAFVCALGDPGRKQTRVEANVNIPSNVVVGYKFRLLEDMTVPHAPIRADWKTPLDVEPATEVAHRAGDVVALNIVETAMFITRIEFAGQFTGGETGVEISAKRSKERPDPLPVLNKIGKGSVKENMELIGTMVGADSIKDGGTVQLKDEYKDSFGVLYRKRSLGSKGAAAPKAAGETQADLAAAFRALYAKKAQ